MVKICTDIRLLASMKEVEEPFEKSQIGKVKPLKSLMSGQNKVCELFSYYMLISV